MSSMNKILDGLWLGDMSGAYNKTTLKRNGITHILTVAEGIAPKFPSLFQYKQIHILDSPAANLHQYFQSCISFIKEAVSSSGTVLVHCFAGVSRSATIVIAYLMQEHGMAYNEAIQFVKKQRYFICPNDGFKRQLQQFNRELKKQRKQQTGLQQTDSQGNLAGISKIIRAEESKERFQSNKDGSPVKNELVNNGYGGVSGLFIDGRIGMMNSTAGAKLFQNNPKMLGFSGNPVKFSQSFKKHAKQQSMQQQQFSKSSGFSTLKTMTIDSRVQKSNLPRNSSEQKHQRYLQGSPQPQAKNALSMDFPTSFPSLGSQLKMKFQIKQSPYLQFTGQQSVTKPVIQGLRSLSVAQQQLFNQNTDKSPQMHQQTLNFAQIKV